MTKAAQVPPGLPVDHPFRKVQLDSVQAGSTTLPHEVMKTALPSYSQRELKPFERVPLQDAPEVALLKGFDAKWGNSAYHDSLAEEAGRQLMRLIGAKLAGASLRTPEQLVRVINDAQLQLTDKAMHAWFAKDDDEPNQLEDRYRVLAKSLCAA